MIEVSLAQRGLLHHAHVLGLESVKTFIKTTEPVDLGVVVTQSNVYDPLLVQSIKELGLRSLPVILRIKDTYLCLDGRKRILAMKALRYDVINCILWRAYQ